MVIDNKGMKKHTFCFGFIVFSLYLQQKYDKSYSHEHRSYY